MTNATVVTTTYFISSGRKNAMYTLRVERRGGGYTSDNYICNLSTDPEKAEAKASEYFDRVSARLTETDTFKMVFQGFADFDLFERRGKLSVFDTEKLELLEKGIMPIGKRKGEVIAEMPMFSGLTSLKKTTKTALYLTPCVLTAWVLHWRRIISPNAKKSANSGNKSARNAFLKLTTSVKSNNVWK